MGIAVAESLEEKGLEFVWVRGGANRKREILRACRIYMNIYQNNANWDNPEKRL
jgi:hypothetical protein